MVKINYLYRIILKKHLQEYSRVKEVDSIEEEDEKVRDCKLYSFKTKDLYKSNCKMYNKVNKKGFIFKSFVEV